MPRLPRSARRHARPAGGSGTTGLLLALLTTAVSSALIVSAVSTDWLRTALPSASDVTEAGLTVAGAGSALALPAGEAPNALAIAPTSAPARPASGQSVRDLRHLPAQDRDHDRLDDTVERAIGTNPRQADSDGDGVRDGLDACPRRAGHAKAIGCGLPVASAAGLLSSSRDRSPAVLFVSPERRTAVRDAALVELTAGDDRGLARVDLYDGPALVCSWSAPPFRCPWQPSGRSVGRRALLAIAHDRAGGTGLARLPVRVQRFTPEGLRVRSRVLREGSRARVLVTGRLDHASAIASRQACRGRVRVRMRDGQRVRRVRTARLTRDCRFTVGAGLRGVPRRAVLRVDASFLGNRTLLPVKVRALRAAPTPRAARLIAGRGLALAPPSR